MTYRYHTERCPHGFALFIRCEQCEGPWRERYDALKNVEPHRAGFVQTRMPPGPKRGASKRQLSLATERERQTG